MRIGAAGKWFGGGIVGATLFCISFCTSFSVAADAQQLDQKVGQEFDQKLYSEMRWRCIGPFRGGRAVAVAGVPRQSSPWSRENGLFHIAGVQCGVMDSTGLGKDLV